MEIHIKTIPHHEQSYNTIGNWWTDEQGVLQIRVSDLGGMDHEMPVVIHELVEWALCAKRGITQAEVDAFDHQFERERAEGEHVDQEPGDAPNAPYRQEHRFSENVERLLVQELGLDWHAYEAELNRRWFSTVGP